jgi:hypothetical protein
VRDPIVCKKAERSQQKQEGENEKGMSGNWGKKRKKETSAACFEERMQIKEGGEKKEEGAVRLCLSLLPPPFVSLSTPFFSSSFVSPPFFSSSFVFFPFLFVLNPFFFFARWAFLGSKRNEAMFSKEF